MNRIANILASILISFTLVACATTLPAGSPTSMSNGVMVNSAGMTVYTFDKDVPYSGKSACNGPCIALWPAVAVTGTPKGDYSVVTRDDGSQQLAYKGKPLYLYVKDQKPGDMTGDNVKDVWHVVRTADNIIHFVFEREQPVWLQQRFDERWNLPRVIQGTGQPSEDAFALRFPEPEEFKRYIRAVAAAAPPRIASMSEAYLAEPVTIKPWGEVRRSEAIGWGLIAHGNGHLGRVGLARTLWGLPGLPF